MHLASDLYSFCNQKKLANDPTDIVVQKKDKETGEASDLSGASLAGAQFTVTYYDGWCGETGTYGSIDELKNLPTEHKRQWVFETKDVDGTGRIKLENPSYLISGDDLYTENERPTYPLGTYVIQETKAPTGYNASTQVWVRTVTQNGDFTAIETFNDLDGDSANAAQNLQTAQNERITAGQFTVPNGTVAPNQLESHS